MPSGLPDAIQALVTDLVARGYTITREQRGGPADDRLLELSHPAHPRVTLSSDRGRWEAGVEVLGETWDAHRVTRGLDGASYSPRALSDEERRAFVLEAITRMPLDPREQAALRDTLRGDRDRP